MVKIFIDPGHGGNDPGAVGNGLREKDVVLDISKRIEAKLKEYEGVETKLSRTDDRTLSLKQRTDDANSWGADYLASIHVNAFNGSANGYKDFIFNGNVPSSTVARQNIMHEEIRKETSFFNNRGKKRANFHMLRESRMDAILTENGFIDNKADADRLKQPSTLDAIAQGHVNGFVKIFGLKKKPTNDPIYRVIVDGKQIFALREKENIIRQLNTHIGKAKEIRLERV